LAFRPKIQEALQENPFLELKRKHGEQEETRRGPTRTARR